MKKSALYWLVLAIILVPVVLNYVLSVPSFTRIVGADTDWLSFWGSYLGAIFSTIVAFVVLYKQLSQNEEQNKLNREANEAANRFNRELQLKIMKYQVGLTNLNQLKWACIKCQEAYAYNKLCHIINLLQKNKDEALTKIADYMELAASAKRGVDIIFSTVTQSLKDLYALNTKLYHDFSTVLLDLEILASCEGMSMNEVFNRIKVDSLSSEELKQVTRNVIDSIGNEEDNSVVNKIMNERLDMFDRGAIEDLWRKAFDYIFEEQQRLSKQIGCSE